MGWNMIAFSQLIQCLRSYNTTELTTESKIQFYFVVFKKSIFDLFLFVFVEYNNNSSNS